MATKVQRAQSWADALTNRATPQAQIEQLADALITLDHMDPAAFTLAQKADVILVASRQWSTSTIKRAENQPVADAATASNSATIEANFAEA